MKIGAAIISMFLTAMPACAQSIVGKDVVEPYLEYRFHVSNDSTGTIDYQYYTVEFEIGDVVFSYTSTVNYCHSSMTCQYDIIEVVKVPEGYVAVPSYLEFDEKSIVTIRVLKFHGM